MTVHCNIHITFPQGTDVYLRGYPVSYAEKPVCGNGGTHHTGEGEGQTATKELLHDTLPISICTHSGFMVSFKDFMIGTDRKDIQLLPQILSFLWRHSLYNLILLRNRAAHILQQNICKLRSYFFNVSSTGLYAEGLCNIPNLLLS